MTMYSNVMVKDRAPRRGDVYYADLNGIEQSIGSEQRGKRPVLVIQNNVGNQHSGTTIIAVLTTKEKRYMPTHIVLDNAKILPMKSVVCTEQLKTIDKTRLQDFQGNVGLAFMKKVDEAIAISLGIRKEQQEKIITIGETMEYIRKETTLDSETHDWSKMAEEQLRFFTNINQYIINLKCKRDELEAEIEEILSYIESTNYNASQGYQVYKLLKDRRMMRRDIIKELSNLEAMIEPFNVEEMCVKYQQCLNGLKGSVKEVRVSSSTVELMAKIG